jgi:hypothetical protein
MKDYFVSFRGKYHDKAVPECRNDGERQAIVNYYDENWNKLEVAGVLEGLTVRSRQEFEGTCCLSGIEGKISILQEFLNKEKLGSVFPSDVVVSAV